MGYTTDFFGKFDLNKRLNEETHKYLVKFNEVRHMKRNMRILLNVKEADKFGVEGEFYVDGGENSLGDEQDETVLDHNSPPSTQPGLWCQWRPSEDGLHIEWDECEKFYEYEAWLVYIINNFLRPKGYILNGSVRYQGEDHDDQGYIVVENNEVRLGVDFLNPPPVPAEQPKFIPAEYPRKINY